MKAPICKHHGPMALVSKGPNGPVWACSAPKCQATWWGLAPREREAERKEREAKILYATLGAPKERRGFDAFWKRHIYGED